MGRLSLPLSVLALGAVGCDLGFDPPSLLSGSPRILALQAEPPEVRPMETVTLDALVWPEEDEARDDVPAVDSWAWRACLLTSSLGFGVPMGDSADRLPVSCFDMDEAYTPEDFLARSLAAFEEGEEPPDLAKTALDLGTEPTATLRMFPLPPFPGPPSWCFDLEPEDRQEQGGRELWISGIRVIVSLRVGAGDGVEVANKRLVWRPAAGAIPEKEQGRPFRTPRLCEDAAETARLCARNVNPSPPRLETPNGEWGGEGPITLQAGDRVKLRPLPPKEDDQQPYVAMRTCGEQVTDPELMRTGGEYERLEARYWAWYVDGGEIQPTDTMLGDEPGTRDASWRAPDEAGTHTLYVVERDARGGVASGEWELRVEARE